MRPVFRTLLTRTRAGGLLTESIWGLAVELLTLGGTILSFTFLGRTLGAAGYGGYASLYAIVGPLVTLAASGVVLAVLQHIVRDNEPIAETARSCLSITLGLGTLLTLIGTGLAIHIVESLSHAAILSILLTEFVTSAVVQVAAGTIQAGTNFTEAAKIRLVLLGARIIVIIALYASDSLTVGSLGVTMLVVTLLLAFWALHRVGNHHGFRFTPGPIRARHLKTNALYSVAISGASLNADGDKLVLAANRLVTDTGLYAAAYRIVSFGLLPIGALIQVTHRRFLVHEEGVVGQHLQRSLKYGTLGVIYGVAFGTAIFASAPLLPHFLGADFAESVVMVRWLAPVVLLRALGTFALNGLMGLNKVALRTALIAVNALIAMVLYVVLIPHLGWQGAAIGTLISEFLVAASTWGALIACQRNDDRAASWG